MTRTEDSAALAAKRSESLYQRVRRCGAKAAVVDDSLLAKLLDCLNKELEESARILMNSEAAAALRDGVTRGRTLYVVGTATTPRARPAAAVRRLERLVKALENCDRPKAERLIVRLTASLANPRARTALEPNSVQFFLCSAATEGLGLGLKAQAEAERWAWLAPDNPRALPFVRVAIEKARACKADQPVRPSNNAMDHAMLVLGDAYRCATGRSPTRGYQREGWQSGFEKFLALALGDLAPGGGSREEAQAWAQRGRRVVEDEVKKGLTLLADQRKRAAHRNVQGGSVARAAEGA